MASWWCERCFGSAQPGTPVSCKCEEPDGFCEYCCGANPRYKRARTETNVVTGISNTVTYLFCNDVCADQWEASA